MITKGPWTLESKRKRASKKTVYEHGEEITILGCGHSVFGIATVSGPSNFNMQNEMRANAQAIAAVPDMIEALKDIALFGFTYCIDADTDRYRVSIPTETYKKIKAALEKAGVK